MYISAIKVAVFYDSENKMQGKAEITLNGMIVIHDIKILKNKDSLFIAMPSRTIQPGKFKDVVHPITAESRGVFERLIFGAFELAKDKKYSCIDLSVDESKCPSFLTQSIEQFDISRSVEYSCANERITHNKAPEQKKVLKPDEDELLKWLES